MNANDVLEHPFSRSDQAAAAEFVARFEYKTTALLLVSEQVRRDGDEAGAELIEELVKAYAEHEAAGT